MLKLFFSSFGGAFINIVIILIGVFVCYMLFKLGNDLDEQNRRFEDSFKIKINIKEGVFNEDLNLENVTSSTVESKDINDWKTEYDKLCTRYNTWTEMIPVLPLLGIFGTVSGLIGMVNTTEQAKMIDNLGIAMTSTWLALIITIALKVYVAVSISRKLYMCDVGYESFVRYKEDSYKSGNIKEKRSNS